MRIFNCNKLKWDIRYIIAYAVVIIASIICGIVLFKLGNISSYVFQYANSYVFYVFNFQNGSIFFSHFLSELFYLYVIFLLSYFTKLKIIAYPIIFLRTVFAVIYMAMLFSFFGAEGIIVAIIVFIPSYLCSIAFLVILCEQCRQICRPLVFFCPAIIALINSVILLLLVNVVFRVIVVIV